MQLTMYQVDAFASRVFEGNPAAVCPLAAWLPDALLQAIAEENNLAETAFFVPLEAGGGAGADFRLRWFTPVNEEDLCGHATLASAAVLFDKQGFAGPEIRFHTRSGLLVVRRRGDQLAMRFPALKPLACETPAALVRGLGAPPRETLAALDYIAVYEREEDVRGIVPDYAELSKLDRRGVVATAPGTDADFVSRFFAPKSGIPEDPVTGSAHCELAPFWAARLGRTALQARQLSRRGGSVGCVFEDEHVLLTGRAVHYMTAEITLPDELPAETGLNEFDRAGQRLLSADAPLEVASR